MWKNDSQTKKIFAERQDKWLAIDYTIVFPSTDDDVEKNSIWRRIEIDSFDGIFEKKNWKKPKKVKKKSFFNVFSNVKREFVHHHVQNRNKKNIKIVAC